MNSTVKVIKRLNKIFPSHISDKRQLVKIYKKLKLNSKKTKNNLKIGNRSELTTQQKYTGGKQAYKQMLHIKSHQGNAK